MLEQGQQIQGLTVGKQLGKGPLAATWQAHAPGGAVTAVIRLLLVRLPEFRDRFERSATVLMGMSHPNLVRIHEMFEHDDLIGVVTEYVDGGDLKDWLARGAPPSPGFADRSPGFADRSPARVVPMFYGIAKGVAAAHAAGLLHRNLKPSKVLVTRDGVPKVAGFALGKVTLPGVDSVTEVGTTFGTPHYMPPEQFRGVAGVDERADLFALGCILYEMLAGQRAFYGEDLLEVYQTVLASDYAPLPAGIPAGLVGIVADLLDPEIGGRPKSVDGLLERFHEDPEIRALLTSDLLDVVGADERPTDVIGEVVPLQPPPLPERPPVVEPPPVPTVPAALLEPAPLAEVVVDADPPAPEPPPLPPGLGHTALPQPATDPHDVAVTSLPPQVIPRTPMSEGMRLGADASAEDSPSAPADLPWYGDEPDDDDHGGWRPAPAGVPEPPPFHGNGSTVQPHRRGGAPSLPPPPVSRTPRPAMSAGGRLNEPTGNATAPEGPSYTAPADAPPDIRRGFPVEQVTLQAHEEAYGSDYPSSASQSQAASTPHGRMASPVVVPPRLPPPVPVGSRMTSVWQWLSIFAAVAVLLLAAGAVALAYMLA